VDREPKSLWAEHRLNCTGLKVSTVDELAGRVEFAHSFAVQSQSENSSATLTRTTRKRRRSMDTGASSSREKRLRRTTGGGASFFSNPEPMKEQRVGMLGLRRPESGEVEPRSSHG